jgi:hypothetical protein
MFASGEHAGGVGAINCRGAVIISELLSYSYQSRGGMCERLKQAVLKIQDGVFCN